MQDHVWQAVLGEIEVSVSTANFNTWFKNTSLLKYKNNELTIGVPNIFIKNQLETKFSKLINDALTNQGVSPGKVEFKIHSGTFKRIADDEPILVSPKRSGRSKSTLSHSYRQGLNERYTFENFIVGSGNELAYAACQAIATEPGKKYNPLFVYGGVGIGKTHLVQAVGNEILKRDRSANVVYVTSEQFVQEFLDAIRFKKNTDFAGYYRSADALIIDDIQFIAGKEKTQEEFFHTFNALHQANKQIIISSDKPPTDLLTLEERLRSRFSMGMSIDMQIPDFETRCAIVQSKSAEKNIQLPPDVVDFLANNIRTNIRELEGVLNQLIATCDMKKIPPSLELAKGIIGSASRPRHVSPKMVIERTAKMFQVSVEDIMSAKRDKDIVMPRQISMYLLRSELKLSFPKIAKELGRKDHTTAMHSVDKIQKMLAEDKTLKSAVSKIKERLYV